METLAKNSHGLWAATAVEAPETRPLQQDHETDVAVIGAGFTGLNAALALCAAGRDVTVPVSYTHLTLPTIYSV